MLGDFVEEALSSVGITSERVSAWLGEECGCKERKDKLNRLHAWAGHVLQGTMHRPREYLERLLKKG